MINLNETVICVKHNTVIEENETRTRVESLGKVQAGFSHRAALQIHTYLHFHVLDQDIVLNSSMFIWVRNNGRRVGLVPTPDIQRLNHKFLKLRVRVLNSEADLSRGKCMEALRDFA